MENLYSFPANQTLLLLNNLVASLPLLISFGLVAMAAVRSLRGKEKKGILPLNKSRGLARAA